VISPNGGGESLTMSLEGSSESLLFAYIEFPLFSFSSHNCNGNQVDDCCNPQEKSTSRPPLQWTRVEIVEWRGPKMFTVRQEKIGREQRGHYLPGWFSGQNVPFPCRVLSFQPQSSHSDQPVSPILSKVKHTSYLRNGHDTVFSFELELIISEHPVGIGKWEAYMQKCDVINFPKN
jgi:hypothetical protein